MKNHFLLAALIVSFIGSGAKAQCPVDNNCVSVDLNFPVSGNGPDISNVPDWTYSHGSPSIGTGFALWSYNNMGEGINYSGYDFIAGEEYTICFEANTSTHDGSPADPNAIFNLLATNGAVGGFSSDPGSYLIPATPIGSQVIVSENWSSYPNPGTGVYTYNFVAADNFDNLWFYPSSPSLPQVTIAITQIVICRVKSCDASFGVCLNDMGDGTSSISAQLNDPSGTILNMTIEEDGLLVYSGLPVAYIGINGKNYRICLAVENSQGEQCKSCYTFCIGKKGGGKPWLKSAKLVSSSQLDNQKSLLSKESMDKQLESELEITIYPNPSSQQFELYSSSDKKITNVKIFDINMKEISAGVINENQNLSNIDMSNQPVGIYIVSIQYTDGSTVQRRIAVER